MEKKGKAQESASQPAPGVKEAPKAKAPRTKKRSSWAAFTLPVIIVLIIAGRLIFDYQNFRNELSVFFSVIRFLVWGFAIFFVLSPFIAWFEKLFSKLKHGAKLLSMIIVYLLFGGVLAVLFVWLLPMILTNVAEITHQIPDWAEAISGLMERIYEWLGQLNIPQLQEWVTETEHGLVDTLAESFGDISLYIIGTSYGILRGVLDFIIGIVISVYMLIEREGLTRRIRKLTYSLLDKDKAKQASEVSAVSGKIFRKFIYGKLIDSAIVGVVSYFVLLIIGAPVPMLLAAIMGITNMVPTIGPIIGAIPCIIITLIISPPAALWVLLYTIFIQLVDGWVLGPHILGESVGLKPFYILAAVLVGGGLFSVLGAFLATPTMAVIQYMLKEYADKKLKEKKITVD
ncbi:MAG: AI-2E family transporter [Eubacteriales bacterium]